MKEIKPSTRWWIERPSFDRISFDSNLMGGKACIRGIRVTVSLVLNLDANGMTPEEIIEAYSYLEKDEIRQAIQYAAWLSEETVHPIEISAWSSSQTWVSPQRWFIFCKASDIRQYTFRFKACTGWSILKYSKKHAKKDQYLINRLQPTTAAPAAPELQLYRNLTIYWKKWQ